MKLRRWLYLIHRWLGIGICLLITIWFFSGVVMMYVGFPELTRSERFAGLPALEAESLRYGPEWLLREVPGESVIEELRLTPVLGRPAYVLRTGDGVWRGTFADTGRRFSSFDAADALQAAAAYAKAAAIESSGATYLRRLDMDQWSVSGSLHAHRPLHLLALNDASDTRLYVSSLTGEVVRDATASERAWNWLGANLHWIYPVQLRRHPTVWHWVVVVLSLAGLVSIVTGAVIGLMRIRLRRPYRGRDITPYRGSMKLHHLLGLCCLIPLATYMFSGLMSMNPWSIFSDEVPFSEHRAAYRGSPTVASALRQIESPAVLRDTLQIHPESRQIIWQWLDGRPYHYVVSGEGERRLLSGPRQDDDRLLHTDWEQLAVAQLRDLMTGNGISSIEQLDAYDSYYYSHHQRWRPLPVLRVQFDDPAGTWFHLDLESGELLNRLTIKGRWQRWLYYGLHSLDFGFLIDHRPAWDLVVITLCLAGFTFSATALTIAWRRLRRRPGHRCREALGLTTLTASRSR